ncbi:uncharacterized protein [Diadema setosum]|uniref:uncharacterized protein n=1 Tax=Diadema setosum TaxID=31175 RepID=UPI003B3A5627
MSHVDSGSVSLYVGLPLVAIMLPPLSHATSHRSPYNPPACDTVCPTCLSRYHADSHILRKGILDGQFPRRRAGSSKAENRRCVRALRREAAWNDRFHVSTKMTTALSPLATYTSLQDKHLVGYFNNTRMKRHLRRAGLVTRNGELVTESTYRLNMARREHQRHVRDLMAQAIVHKTLDLERHRQADIKRKLEEIAKVELVRRVRMDRARKGDEDITPFLKPRGRPKSAYAHQSTRPQPPSGTRPSTAPARHRPKRAGVVYVDQDGFPVHRETPRSDTSEEVDSPALRELDPKILNKISLNLRPEEKEGLSPYSPDITPRPPPSRAKGQRSPRNRTGGVVSKSGRGYKPKSNKGSLALHRKEPAYPHATQLQTMCDVTVRYRGTGLKIEYERDDKRDEVQVYQQHCGGENLMVFSGFAEKGNDLIFVSRRHRGYPFSVTFFVNRVQVLRLSACCEYKYTPGALLGGSKGHFKFIGVHGASPCYRCLVEAELARRERQRYKDVQTDVVVPPPEPVPEFAGMSTQTEPGEEESEKKEESTQKDEEANGGYEDDFEEDEDKKEEKEVDSRPSSSDNFFSEAENEKVSQATEEKAAEDDYAESDFEAESNKDDKEPEEEILDEVLEEKELKRETAEDYEVEDEFEKDDDEQARDEKEEKEIEEENQKGDSDEIKEEKDGEEDEEIVREEAQMEEEIPEEKDDAQEIGEEMEDKKEDDREEEQSVLSDTEGDNRLLSSDDEGDKESFSGDRKPTASEADFKISSSADEDEDDKRDEKTEDTTDEEITGEKSDQEENEKERQPEDEPVEEEKKEEEEATQLERSLSEEVTIETEIEPPAQEAVLVKEAVLVSADEDGASVAEEQVLVEDTPQQSSEPPIQEEDEDDADGAGAKVSSDHEENTEDQKEEKDESPRVDKDEEEDADRISKDQGNNEEGDEQSVKEVDMDQQTANTEDTETAPDNDAGGDADVDGPPQTASQDVAEDDKQDEDDTPKQEPDETPKQEPEESPGSQDAQEEPPQSVQDDDVAQVKSDSEEAQATKESSELAAPDNGQQEEPSEEAKVEETSRDDADGIATETAGDVEEKQDEEDKQDEGKEEQPEESLSEQQQESTPKDEEPSNELNVSPGGDGEQEKNENEQEKAEEKEKEKEKEEDKEESKAEVPKDEGTEEKNDKGKQSDSSSSSSSSSSDSEDEEAQKIKLSGFIREHATDSSYSRLALNMSEKSLGPAQAQQIAKALLDDPKYKSVEYFLIRGNPIQDKGVASIIQSLITLHHQIPEQTDQDEDPPKTGLKLTHLDLGDTKMTNKGAVEVSELLKQPTNITNINLSDNSIGRIGCKALAAGIRCNTSLRTLSIEYAALGDSGCREIIEAVRDHPALQELNLEGNDITDESARAILQLVKDNSILTTINFMRDNHVTQEVADEVEEILKTGEFLW